MNGNSARLLVAERKMERCKAFCVSFVDVRFLALNHLLSLKHLTHRAGVDEYLLGDSHDARQAQPRTVIGS